MKNYKYNQNKKYNIIFITTRKTKYILYNKKKQFKIKYEFNKFLFFIYFSSD